MHIEPRYFAHVLAVLINLAGRVVLWRPRQVFDFLHSKVPTQSAVGTHVTKSFNTFTFFYTVSEYFVQVRDTRHIQYLLFEAPELLCDSLSEPD